MKPVSFQPIPFHVRINKNMITARNWKCVQINKVLSYAFSELIYLVVEYVFAA